MRKINSLIDISTTQKKRGRFCPSVLSSVLCFSVVNTYILYSYIFMARLNTQTRNIYRGYIVGKRGGIWYIYMLAILYTKFCVSVLLKEKQEE